MQLLKEMALFLLHIFSVLCWFFQGIQGRNISILSPTTSITRFLLFTPGAQSPELITADSPGTTFNPSLRLSLIIHGYLNNGGENWIKSMRKELMKRQQMNIIVVDWGQGSLVTYDTAVRNTRKVGAAIAKLLGSLQARHSYNVSNIHVIGHSLGAHIAGFAGAAVWLNSKQRLGRITGLDPASPTFNHNSITDRLDSSDAQFVDVIHTDIGLGGLGLARPCGHVDFYPNGGNNQPGCAMAGDWTALYPGNLVSSIVGNSKNTFPLSWQFVCDHLKVLSFFTSSINTNCSRASTPCGSWHKFTQGRCPKCKGACPEMGYNADQSYHSKMSSGKKHYLKTSSGHPFCGVPIKKYSIYLSGLELKDYSYFGGSSEIKVSLNGQNGVTIASNTRNIDSHTSYLEMNITCHVNPGTLTSMTITYKGTRPFFVGKATVQGPENTYEGQYNKYLSSSSYFFLFNRARSFKTRLVKCPAFRKKATAMGCTSRS